MDTEALQELADQVEEAFFSAGHESEAHAAHARDAAFDRLARNLSKADRKRLAAMCDHIG